MIATSRPVSGKLPSRQVLLFNQTMLLAIAALIAPHPLESQTAADEIVIRGGQRIQGKLVDDPKQPGRVLIWLSQGRNPLSFTKAQIADVIPHASALDDYVLKRSAAANSPQGQVDLGAWCVRNKLDDLARSHFETALNIDPTFEPAHLNLGHVLQNGEWKTRDQLIDQQAAAKQAARPNTTEGKAKRESHSPLTSAETSWIRRIRVMHHGLVNGPDDRRREAESQLMAIREPDAVTPLIRVFGTEERPLRLVLALILGSIDGRESTTAMVRQLLYDPDAEIRAAFLDQLSKRDRATVIPPLVRALNSADVRLVNRSAWALGNLDAIEAVPKLINALVSTKSEIVMDSGMNNEEVVAGGSLPWALKTVTPSGVAAYQSPPVMAPGVIAYGAAVGPFYGPTLGPYGGPVLGVNAQTPSIPEPRLATFTYQNVEVLTALQRLTRQDFGYDISAWRHWVSRSFNANQRPPRRVNQP